MSADWRQSMSDRSFLQYVGDSDFHDGRVVDVRSKSDAVRVRIRGANGKVLVAEFGSGRVVRANRPDGMLLYALCEFRCEPPSRKFIFANWDDEDDAALEIDAETFMIHAENE